MRREILKRSGVSGNRKRKRSSLKQEMLSRIFIKNFALIDKLEIDLSGGMQVITGGTGAGKSIILNALRLIFGQRADNKTFNNPEEKSIFEADFKLGLKFKAFFEENDLDFEEISVFRREILPSGKSRAFINDVPVTLDTLKTLSSSLIDIHSQFETSNLFTTEYQFKILDSLSENKNIISEYQEEYKKYLSLKTDLENLKFALSNKSKEADYNNYLLSELQEIDLDNINFEEIQNQVFLQENASSISESISESIQKLQQDDLGVLSSLNEIKNKIQKISNASASLESISKRIEESYYELKDLESSLESELEKVEINPDLLNKLLSDINKINSLFLKHNVSSVSELIETREKLSKENYLFENTEVEITRIENEIKNTESKMDSISGILSENRKKSIPICVNTVEELVKKMGLEKAKFDVELQSQNQFNNFGKDSIQLLFQANSGFSLNPIQNAISGGERSRVMLAIKALLAENSELPTLILDEIDTGVSGKVADEIGKVMQQMSKNMQLIVITHLAQVAAKGNNNYKVVKEDVDGKTQSNIIPLSKEQKVNEIAQLLSGSEITDAAILQAKELIEK